MCHNFSERSLSYRHRNPYLLNFTDTRCSHKNTFLPFRVQQIIAEPNLSLILASAENDEPK